MDLFHQHNPNHWDRVIESQQCENFENSKIRWTPSIGYNRTYHESVLQLSRVSFWGVHRVPPLQTYTIPAANTSPYQGWDSVLQLPKSLVHANESSLQDQSGRYIRISIWSQSGQAKWRHVSTVYVCLSMLPNQTSLLAEAIGDYIPQSGTKNLASDYTYVFYNIS